MLHGYGILNNHVPTLKATVMKIGAAISTLLTGLYAVYKGESDALASLTTSLYAVYKGESNTNDSLGTYNGTAQGGLTYTAGKSGNAFTFNGTNAYVQLPNNSFNSILSGDFSIGMWVNTTSLSSFQTLFSNFKSDGGGVYHGIILGINSNQFRFQIHNNTTEVLLQAGFSITTNTWNHIVITRKYSTGTKIYVNGSLNTSNTNVTNPDVVALMYANIGAYMNASGVPSGEYMSNGSKIDEVNVWNKELTSTEITDLYNSGNGKFYQGNTFSSTVVNDALATYNGTAQGGLTYTAGKSGNAFTFNGTDAYVSLPTNTLSSLTDFSISFWYNPSSLPGGSALVGNYTWIGGIDRGYLFYLNYGTLYFRLWGSSTVDLVASGTFSTNTWYHVVLTRKESTRSKIYINGSLNASNTSTVNPNYTTTNYNSLGASQYNATNKEYYCDGKMDEVNIWSKELTATEVTELYNAGAGKFYPY